MRKSVTRGKPNIGFGYDGDIEVRKVGHEVKLFAKYKSKWYDVSLNPKPDIQPKNKKDLVTKQYVDNKFGILQEFPFYVASGNTSSWYIRDVDDAANSIAKWDTAEDMVLPSADAAGRWVAPMDLKIIDFTANWINTTDAEAITIALWYGTPAYDTGNNTTMVSKGLQAVTATPSASGRPIQTNKNIAIDINLKKGDILVPAIKTHVSTATVYGSIVVHFQKT